MYIRSLFENNRHITEPRQQRVRSFYHTIRAVVSGGECEGSRDRNRRKKEGCGQDTVGRKHDDEETDDDTAREILPSRP